MKSDHEINRLEYSIVKKIHSFNCTNRFNGVTITEIIEKTEGVLATRMTLYKKLRKLVNVGYIAKGVTDDHADTYYITDDGIKLLDDIEN